MLFQPVKEHAPIRDKLGDTVEDFYFESFDQTRLHGWYLPLRVNANTPQHTVLFLHGNAINISSHIGGVYWMPDYGIEAFIFDYRGFGKSEGIADLAPILTDIGAAIEYVNKKKKSHSKLVIVGHSIGASMGLAVASQARFKDMIGAFVSISAFSDYRVVTREMLSRHWLTWLFQWPLSLTISNEYRPLDYVSYISPVPLFFMHGKHDDIIKSHHTQSLYEAALEPKQLFWLESNHNDVFSIQTNRQKIIDYLSTLAR
ncbi:MAG: lysophospholipase [Gammaproteobacteria bacterium]|nr:lysophospholipase [Gammaproteobacteria bacterium]